jgi:2-polyprenyl-3-methyl-5-hydroxy-6-metoxy-1,4-benzoquinol methylase
MTFFLREQPSLCDLPVDAIEWEECPCLLCGSSKWSPLVEGTDRSGAATGKWFLVVQCQDCGLCFTNPRPSRRSMAQFYSMDYPPHQAIHGAEKRLHLAEKRPSVRHHPWARLWASPDCRKVMPLHGEGRLLDFGCGTGSYLWRMHRQGWKVMGVDQSAAATEYVRHELGLPALVGSLPHEDLQPGCFDVVTMWQSLEHVHRPMEVLRAARRLLAPGGKLIVAVPNIDSLPFRWFGPTWIGLDLPRHLSHFTPQSLTRMLSATGFRPGPARMVRRCGWLRSSAHLACLRSRGASRFQRWLRGKTVSNLASWFGYLTQRSDCMMVTAELAPAKLA